MSAPGVGYAISEPSQPPGADAAGRRAEAVRRVLQLRPLAEVRQAVGLDAVDEQVVGERVRAAYPWIADIVLGDGDEDDVGLCPEVSLHPAVPLPDRVVLGWCADDPGTGRVVEHTCTCPMTSFELLSYGGLYRLRRTTVPRPRVPAVSYTGAWRRLEAFDWWRRLIAGHAR